MAMNLNRNDIMTVWNKCFFFISQTIKISSTYKPRHVQNETKNNSKYALIYNTVS